MPAEIKNLKKVASRILKAIKKNENIILYGDGDLDGVSSVIILKETIKSLGGKVAGIYFPDRGKEGYGINENALDFLKNLAPAIFLSLDCGIGNFEEVKIAKKIGFEVIIIDHHEVLERLPQASIVVDPKQKDDKYPFKQLSNTAIVFKLSQALLKNKKNQSLKKSFLELTALATLADMMPETEENKIFIEEGLDSLKSTWRPGLKVFFEINSMKDCKLVREVAQKIVSAINTGENQNHLHESYLLLTASSEKEAKDLALNLLEKAVQKKAKIREVSEGLAEEIGKKPENTIIFEGGFDWPMILIGSIASKICHQFQKPTFIFKKNEKESQGAVRVPKGLNGVAALMECREFLKTFGGHPQAAGFRVKNENLEKLEKCLIKYFSNL